MDGFSLNMDQKGVIPLIQAITSLIPGSAFAERIEKSGATVTADKIIRDIDGVGGGWEATINNGFRLMIKLLPNHHLLVVFKGEDADLYLTTLEQIAEKIKDHIIKENVTEGVFA